MKPSEESDTNNHLTTSNPQRTTHKSDWRLFAAAGSAALAAGSAADAAIIYVNPASPEVATVPGAAPYNGDGFKTFAVDGVSLQASAQASARAPAAFAVLRGFDAYSTGKPSLEFGTIGRLVHKFASGQPIVINGAATSAQLGGKDLGNRAGSFTTGKTGFAGFRLPTSKGGGLGWMRFEVVDRDHDGYPDELEAIDWAYNNAGGGINAGQTGSSVPEPSALGLLAMDSAGVLAWRRRRTAVASNG